METFERNIDNITEEEDYGCIVGCALTDTLQEIMAGLSGGYAIMSVTEEMSANPDMKKLSRLKKRREELVALKSYFAKSGKSYNDLRRWIKVYSDELKHVDTLRKEYDHTA
jgi:uncharacterized protein YoaH (UPF0181 family)